MSENKSSSIEISNEVRIELKKLSGATTIGFFIGAFAGGTIVNLLLLFVPVLRVDFWGTVLVLVGLMAGATAGVSYATKIMKKSLPNLKNVSDARITEMQQSLKSFKISR